MSLGRLEAAAEKVEQFNAEEEAYEWELSHYPLRKDLDNTLAPYLKLYDTTVEFNTKHKCVILLIKLFYLRCQELEHKHILPSLRSAKFSTLQVRGLT